MAAVGKKNREALGVSPKGVTKATRAGDTFPAVVPGVWEQPWVRVPQAPGWERCCPVWVNPGCVPCQDGDTVPSPAAHIPWGTVGTWCPCARPGPPDRASRSAGREGARGVWEPFFQHIGRRMVFDSLPTLFPAN